MDYGGPRKEFFLLFLREATDRLMEAQGLVQNAVFLGQKYYYVFGLVVGMYASSFLILLPVIRFVGKWFC